MNITTESNIYCLYFDGGSRGNPGLCGIGFVIYKNNEILYKHSSIVSENNTNNYAEYCALIKGLEKVIELNIKNIKIYGDSQLIIKQLNGKYQVKSKNIKPLFLNVKTLIKSFIIIELEHIYREKNKLADSLANLAMNNYKK